MPTGGSRSPPRHSTRGSYPAWPGYPMLPLPRMQSVRRRHSTGSGSVSHTRSGCARQSRHRILLSNSATMIPGGMVAIGTVRTGHLPQSETRGRQVQHWRHVTTRCHSEYAATIDDRAFDASLRCEALALMAQASISWLPRARRMFVPLAAHRCDAMAWQFIYRWRCSVRTLHLDFRGRPLTYYQGNFNTGKGLYNSAHINS